MERQQKKAIFFKVEILSTPLSSGFTGKYFFSVDISSGFGAKERNKVHYLKKIILEHKNNFSKVRVHLKITSDKNMVQQKE